MVEGVTDFKNIKISFRFSGSVLHKRKIMAYEQRAINVPSCSTHVTMDTENHNRRVHRYIQFGSIGFMTNEKKKWRLSPENYVLSRRYSSKRTQNYERNEMIDTGEERTRRETVKKENNLKNVRKQNMVARFRNHPVPWKFNNKLPLYCF